MKGVSYFDEFNQYFKDNYDLLGPVYLENKKPSSFINRDNKAEVINLHDAYVNELRNGFSSSL